MKGWGLLAIALLTARALADAQTMPATPQTMPATPQTFSDSTFSLFFNCSMSFTHANDPHLNRWLAQYGYPAEPHVPTSLNFETAAMPANSRLLFSINLSTISNAKDLSTYSIGAGLFAAAIKTKQFLLFFGGSVGYHADIVSLNGSLPPAYEDLAVKYNTSLSLRRGGLSVAPMMRIFWFPIRLGNSLQIGIIGGAGYALDLNSNWRLGYYSNEHGKYNHFKRLVNKPSDQHKTSEHGVIFDAGISVRFNLH
jgi:hypothetical protein